MRDLKLKIVQLKIGIKLKKLILDDKNSDFFLSDSYEQQAKLKKRTKIEPSFCPTNALKTFYSNRKQEKSSSVFKIKLQTYPDEVLLKYKIIM